MPGISGLDLLKELAEMNSEILTVMITAYASLDVAISATKRGIYDFLAKPFTPEELKSAVRKAAKHVILQRQARKLAEEKRQVRFQFISVLVRSVPEQGFTFTMTLTDAQSNAAQAGPDSVETY